jgi:putative selenium metabolism protein SsnA
MKKLGYLIINGKLITWGMPNQILDGYALLIQDGCIGEIAQQKGLMERFPNVKLLDAHGQYIMPGLICAHTHFYSAFSRGMPIPGEPAKDFPEILSRLWWPLDLSLDEQAIRYSVLVSVIDAIRHGTTTLVDHHASPNYIDGSLDVISDAILSSGVRASLCYEVTDRNGLAGAKAGIEENLRFIHGLAAHSQDNKQLSAMFGLHASLTLSDVTLDDCRQAVPTGTGFHIHVAEHEVDETDSINKSGMRVVERLEKYQLLGPDSLLVHGVHIDDGEIEIVSGTHTWLTHQPRSNMNNGVGLPQVEKMLASGIKVCLGNDGFSNTMWDEWKTAYLAHKLWNRDPRRMSADKVVQMGVYNNSELARMLFHTKVGILDEGAQADLIFVDYHPYTPVNTDNLPWQIIFGFHESMITTTIVGGEILMQDRKLLTVDEEEICSKAMEFAPMVWERYFAQRGVKP